ncbi:TPM domain-containing protein [Tissierella sp.]|uniref:TPM domain-containing protein n=1 Tax=Tissierella sp. TaxID=41274 RepID=UPI0028608099|nr:TPM domain-containing protein [Tissierella sp.]MDR7857022.1 TPM domain-containing protein [Tissierella sp.]
MKKNRKIFIILCTILLLTTTAFGASNKLPEPNYDFYVYDEANVIDKEIESYILEVNKELYKKTGAQVVVATINSLEGADINSYSTSLFEEWKIGSDEYDNGMLLLIVPTDRELWIEVGYGLEGPFPDSKVNRIIDNYILPYFSEGEYSNGILSGFNQILIGLEEEYTISLDKSLTIEDHPSINDSNESEFNFLSIPIIIGIIILIIIDFKFFGGWITYAILRNIGRGSSGGSRGGRSSGGGGRSGGGGAGGKW